MNEEDLSSNQHLCWISDHDNQLAWLRWLPEPVPLQVTDYAILADHEPHPTDPSRLIQFQGCCEPTQNIQAEFKYWLHRGMVADDIQVRLVLFQRETKDAGITVHWRPTAEEDVVTAAEQFAASLLTGFGEHGHLPLANADIYFDIFTIGFGCERAYQQAGWICSQVLMVELSTRGSA